MTKTNSAIRIPHSAIVWLLLALAVIFIYFFALGTIPLLGPDEPRYAQVAREMFERGDWITPTLGGANWFEKPALLYWLEIISYKLFGVSEFSARSGAAVFGLLTIFSLYLLGRFFNAKEQRRKLNYELRITNYDFANGLFLISASSIGLLTFSHGASFDIILTFPVTASLCCFFIFDSLAQRRKDAENFCDKETKRCGDKEKEVKPQMNADERRLGIKEKEKQIRNPHSAFRNRMSPRLTVSVSLVGFYFFIGVAILAKGLVGIVLPISIVFFYYILIRKFPSKIFIFSLVWGTFLSLLVASVWYLPMYLRHGWTFIDEFFIQHHFARYTSNKYLHPQPFWFFLLVLPLMTLPWLPFFLMSIWDFVFSRKDAKAQRREEEKEGISPQRRRDTEREIKLQINLRERRFEDSFSPCLRVSASPRRNLKIFALAWMIVPLVFFSLSGSKLPGYILPALPAALVLTAEYVSRFVQNNQKREIALQILAAAMFLGVALALQFFVKDFARSDTVKDLILAADTQGYRDAKILNAHTISHNAEFYGAGRLIRDTDGKVKKFYGATEIAQEVFSENGKTVLVLIPLEYAYQLNESDLVSAKFLGDNGELALFAISNKENQRK